MNRKPWIRITALVTVLALCLTLPRLLPVLMQASAANEPYGLSFNTDVSIGSSEEDTVDPGADGAGDDTASEEFDEGDAPPTATDQDPDGLGEEEPEPPLSLGLSGLIRSDLSVPGYNVFEVDSYAKLAEALSTTSYPSEADPETSVYILLTGNVSIEAEFTLHQSIDKVVIDGDKQHALSEKNLIRSHVSAYTSEVTFKDLTIHGNQYYGLLDNPHSTNVSYRYERVTYTGPQLLWASQSTAYFTDCDISIIGAGNVAHEVAEIRDVYIQGNNQFRHNSPNAVFYLYNNGNLILSQDTVLRINATGANNYILFTEKAQSTLRLEDRAIMRVEGTSSQLAASAGLHSIYLGDSAAFHWEAHRAANAYIAVNASGGAKDAIYLSEGAEFRVAPNGTPSAPLIRINGGNVVVGPGASLSLRSVLYNASNSDSPFYLRTGSMKVGKSATFTMEIGNRSDLSTGLLTFDGRQSSLVVDRDATVVLRGNRTRGAVCFSGFESSVAITDPNYLEIAVSTGFPIIFFNASVAYPSTLTYTDVQQINYWRGGSKTYLNGGRTVGRWVAETEGFAVKATFSGNRNGSLSTELTGGSLDPLWTPTLSALDFDMNDARILSVGRIGMEQSSDGNAYQGRITAPTMSVPYANGYVQLRVGLPKADRAVSSRTAATPEFHVVPNQTVGGNDEISVWGEYGYVFHNNPPSLTAGTLSLTAPTEIQFGTLPVSFSDLEASAQGAYTLHVQDQRGRGNHWQILASFSGFYDADRALDGTLVVNDIPLQEIPRLLDASSGNQTIGLSASLLVPGGAADAGAYTGSITWTLVDAP